MRTVALISGGKDSCYNMLQCVGAGHSIVALANLQPLHKDELDSYMYQTVGHQGIDLYAEAMDLPLYRESISGSAVDRGRNYNPTDNDEVEDLYRLLSRVKDEMDIEAVSVGAILCHRLGLVSLAYLWRRNQKELLQEMIDSGVDAIIIKPHLLVMHDKYGLNVCGEGGEYETFTLDCPLKPSRAEPPRVRTCLDYIADLSDNVFSDISDLELSETELDSIEKLEKEEKKKQKELNPLLTYSGDIVESADDVDGQDDSAESIERCACAGAGEAHAQGARPPVPDHRSIHGNRQGWHFVGGIVGEGADTRVATEDAMNKLINSKNLRLPDICSVNIYMRDMNEYAQLNDVYVRTFSFPNPPTRVCVQCPLPADVGLILDAVAHKPSSDLSETDTSKERLTMHVQGISHWAPANIGPYSQAIKIALVPGSMVLAGGGARRQCALALRHLTRVIRAVEPRAHIRSVVQCSGVEALPRQAAVEWHAWAHSHNTRFECKYRVLSCSAQAWRRCRDRRPSSGTPGRTRTTLGLSCAGVEALPRQAAVEWHAWAHSHNTRFECKYRVPSRSMQSLWRCRDRRPSSGTPGRTRTTLGLNYAVVEALPRQAAVEWHAWAHSHNTRFELVEALPRQAAVEWHAWAHSHNTRFDYEETGCNVGSSPSTCQLSFASEEACRSHRALAASMPSARLEEVLEYALRKLVSSKEPPHSAVKCRIFYQ
ncbi:putative atpase pp-loop superfamily, partial [Operophtera brumata]